MKKLGTLLLALVMCLTLAACGSGGPNKQSAIDAHNKAADAVNALTEIINQNPDAYADYLDNMQTLIDRLNECGQYLESGEDLTQEDLDEWVQVCGDIEDWALAAKAEIEG